MTELTLREIADYISATLSGNAGLTITGIAGLSVAEKSDVSFLANRAYRDNLATTGAGAVIIRAEEADLFDGNKLIVDNPYLSYARLSRLFDASLDKTPGAHSSSVVEPSAVIGEGAHVGPCAVIGAGAKIGPGAFVGAGCVVGEGSIIGARTRLAANVTVYHGVVIGEDCLLQSGCVIGGDGFGYAPNGADGGWCKIHQLGGVRIGNRVEIGASTAIDRGALEDTIIADGVIIDNLVHIAHNCIIGENTAIAGSCGFAGSTKVGRNCTFAGMVGVTGHIEIADDVHVTGMTMVTKSLLEPGSYSSGTSATPSKLWRKNAVRFNQLNDIASRLKTLESKFNK